MSGLFERESWDLLLAPFKTAREQYLERAARAEGHDDHLLGLGRLEGMERAIDLLVTARERMMRASGDVRY